MRNDVRRNPRLAGLAGLLLVQLAVIACDKMPLTAPSGSALTVTSPTVTLPLGGSTPITATVSESGGTPVQNGTVVRFTTNLGRVDPVDAQTMNGMATTTFHAGDVSGEADIRATSGSIAGTGDNPGVKITVGAAAIQEVQLRASPQFVPFGGGTVQLIATVIGPNARVLPGTPVTFASTQGTLGAVQAVTDGNGEARTTLTTDRDAQVTATAGTKTSPAVSITRRAAPVVPTVTLTADGATAIAGVGQRWTFTAAVTGTDDTGPAVRWRWNFGDDTTAETNSSTVTHIYTQPLTRRVVTVEVQLSNGQTISAVTEIIVANF